jgi:chromosomal replication initiator protein
MINPNNIIKSVEQAYNMPNGVILSNRRSKTAVEARSVAMYLTRKLTTYSLTEIGEQFNRDHTSVLHSCNKMVKIVQMGCKNQAYNTTMNLIDQFLTVENK